MEYGLHHAVEIPNQLQVSKSSYPITAFFQKARARPIMGQILILIVLAAIQINDEPRFAA